MFLSTNSTISNDIIETLADGPGVAAEVFSSLQKKHGVTKQGFYKALRTLISEEIVVKSKRNIFLSNTWVNKLREFALEVDESYGSGVGRSKELMQEGESLVFHFRSMVSLDALWMHYFFLLAKKKSADVLLFSQHEWYSLFRPEAESYMYEWLRKSQRRSYTVIGHNTILDRSTTAYIKNDFMELAYERKSSFRHNLDSTVIDDYIIDTIVDHDTALAIDALYLRYEIWSEDLLRDLHEIIGAIKLSKVVITRDHERAEKIRRKLLKYFIFYRPSKKSTK